MTRVTPSRVAIHEAGHGLMSVLLGFTDQGPISVQPTETYNGICFTGTPGSRLDGAADLDTPVPLLDAELRRTVETRVMVLMAGCAAEDLATRMPHRFRWIDTPDQPSAPTAPPAPTRLPANETRALAKASTDPGPGPAGDEDRIRETLKALHDDRTQVANAHYWLLLTECQHLLTEHCDRLFDLAAAVDQAGILPAADWLPRAGAAI